MDKYFVSSGYANIINSLVYVHHICSGLPIRGHSSGSDWVWCKYQYEKQTNKQTLKNVIYLCTSILSKSTSCDFK